MSARFICPEVDPKADRFDLFKGDQAKGETLDGQLERTFLNEKNGNLYYLYGRPLVLKYLSMFEVPATAKTIAEYQALTGIVIETNLGGTIEALSWSWTTAELLALRSEIWFTIFADDGIKFYKPVRLATSVQVSGDVVERISIEKTLVGYYGDPDVDIWAGVSHKDTIIPGSISDDIKTLLKMTMRASLDMIRICSRKAANPMDYYPLGTGNYLLVSAKYEATSGNYYYWAVKEQVNQMQGYSNNIIPTMTSNSSPSPFVASASTEYTAAYQAFDKDADTYWYAYPDSSPWLRIYLGANGAKAVCKYTITAGLLPQPGIYLPSAWTFEGSNNGTDWDILDTKSGETLTTGVKKEYTFANSTKYLYYRINISAVTSDYALIKEFEMMTLE